MTTTDPMSTRPKFPPRSFREMVDPFYAELGLTSLSAALESGEVHGLPDEELQPYANTAAVAVHGGPVRSDGVDAQEEVREWMAWSLFQIIGGENLELRDDGSAWLLEADGPTELTAVRVRHIEWVLELMTWRGVAERFLAAMTTEVRDRAMVRAAFSWDAAFEEVVKPAE